MPLKGEHSSTQASTTQGLLWVSALGAFWGLSVAAARVAISSGFSPILFAVCETALISLIAAVVLVLSRSPVGFGRPRLELWFVNGVFVVVIPYLVSYTALTRLSAGEVTVVLALSPVFTALFAGAFGFEKITRWTVAGALMGLAGVLIIARGASPSQDPSNWTDAPWVALAVVSPACYGLANVYIVSRGTRVTSQPVANVLGTNVVAFAVLGVITSVAYLAGFVEVGFDLTDSRVSLFFIIAALANASANLLFFLAARRTPATILALSGYLTTLSGVFFGILLAGERIYTALLIGGAVILSAVYIGNRSRTA